MNKQDLINMIDELKAIERIAWEIKSEASKGDAEGKVNYAITAGAARIINKCSFIREDLRDELTDNR